MNKIVQLLLIGKKWLLITDLAQNRLERWKNRPESLLVYSQLNTKIIDLKVPGADLTIE